MGISYVLLTIGLISSMPLHTSTDELGAVAGAALFAGRDWSGVISNSGYYGFGYYSLFFWLFKITDSPIIIYRVIVITTAMLRVLMIPIAYYIAKEYLALRSEKMLYIGSCLMPFLYTSSIGVITNEYILELMFWLVILLLCKIIQYHENRVKKRIYITLLFLACCYLPFIHTRALTILIALSITVIGYSLYIKDYRYFLFVAGIPIAYLGSKEIILLYQQRLYGASGEEIGNGAVLISKTFSLFDFDTWDVWIHMLIGMIDTEIILTGGFFLICIVTFLFYLKDIFVSCYEGTKLYYNIVLCISILCMGATIFAFLLSNWFEGMLIDWKVANTGGIRAYKGLTYIRYWNIYMPPFALCSLGLLKSLDYKKIFGISMIVIVPVHLFFIQRVVPLICENGWAASPFYGLAGFRQGDLVNKEYYYKCLLLSMLIFLLAVFAVHSRYKQIALYLIIFLMVSSQITKIVCLDTDVRKNMSSKILASYEEKKKLDQRGVDIGQIYVEDLSKNKDKNWQIYSIAQFYFNRYTLQMELPEVLEYNDIIISTSKSEEIEKRYEDVLCYKLDENEYWYTYLLLQ